MTNPVSKAAEKTVASVALLWFGCVGFTVIGIALIRAPAPDWWDIATIAAGIAAIRMAVT